MIEFESSEPEDLRPRLVGRVATALALPNTPEFNGVYGIEGSHQYAIFGKEGWTFGPWSELPESYGELKSLPQA